MLRLVHCALVALCVIKVGNPSIHAASEPESWTDSDLKIRNGLVLWLDASTLNRSRESLGLSPIPASGPVDLWFDGSGSKKRFGQRVAEARPKLLPLDGGQAIVRFDGKDDFLNAQVPGSQLNSFSLFLMAAPKTNPGLFPALFAANAYGKNDYTNGFTVDLGPFGTSRFETLNLEGTGFGGASDMMEDTHRLGSFHQIEAIVSDSLIVLAIDGRPQKQRSRQPVTLKLDELTLGARFYSNDPPPPSIKGFLDCDVAEVLLFDHALSESETVEVRHYLENKYKGIDARIAKLADPRARPLQTVANPPPVQMLMPGFEVKELPLKLTNINNVHYRPDGKLVALAYNGDVHLLTDTNGDGLEDHAELFWENNGRLRSPIGMALTPPGYALGSGVFVAAKGKVSLLLDADGDDRAEKEVIVAQGWPELDHGVDALGVAVARDGSVYFGLGTGDFTNAFRLDREGRSSYDLKAERGAILKVAPDFKSREMIATGIRFPVGMAFNTQGDLFATDQEGATWLPNGNPFDELLHIQTKRHYGFPPRHPKYLPSVIDEPSTFDYAPQHQSTCGLTFNEPSKNGSPTFGPDWWKSDALVCGYSRGKIYRTKLVSTPLGYVAHNDLIACLDKLTVDCAIALDGSLVVACHSGGPDWGSGPNGSGTLYKVRYKDRGLPQPVAAWPESPTEVCIAFDRPLTPSQLSGIADKFTIEQGRAVAPGDRFEVQRPGYAAVGAQLAAPRLAVAIRGVNVSADRRTIVIATEADASPFPHAISWADNSRTGVAGLKQNPQIDLGYDLTGVEASWKDNAGKTAFSGWIPHLDLDVSRALVRQSAKHQPFLEARDGSLTLSGKLDVRDLLRPALQPGSTVDAVLPKERVIVTIEGSGPFSAKVGNQSGESASGTTIELPLGEVSELVPITVTLQTAHGSVPHLMVATKTDEDLRLRPLPLRRIFVPWTGAAESSGTMENVGLPPEIDAGSWTRGRALFFGEQAKCSKCHALNGQGNVIGPDLGNLSQRDAASVLRDIRDPSITIHPDHIAQVVALKDGRVLTGIVRNIKGSLSFGDTDGKVTTVAATEVEEMKPSTVSTMPTGLLDALGSARTNDLLKFLLTPDLKPAPIEREGSPQPRTISTVDTVLKSLPASDPKSWKPELKVLLVAGPKDHGIGEHDYPLWKERWPKLLARAEGVSVRTAEGWPSEEDFNWADVAVWYSANNEWSTGKKSSLDRFLTKGGGLVYLHFAVNGQQAADDLAERIGLAWKPGPAKFRHGALNLKMEAEHPITAGMKSFAFEDESYWDLVGDTTKINVLATSKEDGKDRPMIWTHEQGRGRVVGCILGHYSWTLDDPIFRILVLRSISWTAREPADRLQELTKLGARIKPD